MKIWLDKDVELSSALKQLTDDKIDSGDFCHQTVIDLRNACRLLKAELDAAIEYHIYYRSEIDKALGEPRGNGDLLANHLTQIKKLKGETPADKFEIGDKCTWVVGMPGADVDTCEIIADNGDGTYQIKYQVYGQGEFFERTAYSGGKFAVGRLLKKIQ